MAVNCPDHTRGDSFGSTSSQAGGAVVASRPGAVTLDSAAAPGLGRACRLEGPGPGARMCCGPPVAAAATVESARGGIALDHSGSAPLPPAKRSKAVTECTLVLIKPDAVRRGLAGEVLSRIERKGLKIVAMDLRIIPAETAEAHYAEHVGKPFFTSLITFITSGPLVALVVQRSEEHTSELQAPCNLVCRLLL